MTAQTNPPIHIALVDDEALFLSGLQSLLNREEAIVVDFTATDGTVLLNILNRPETALPDVLLLDLRMKPMDGLETTRALREQFPELKVVILSTYYRENYLAYMVKLGVSGFLPKNIDPGTLVRVIQKVHEKGLYLTDEQVGSLQQNLINGQQSKAPLIQHHTPLTKREEEVLALLCDQCTSQEIADQLFISLRTVEGHRNNLLVKTGAKNTVGLVLFAIQHQVIKVHEKLAEFSL